MRGAVLLALWVFAPVPDLQAQAVVHTDVDTALVTVGDRITLTVTVEHDPAAVVVWPDSISLPPFEVLEAALSRSEEGPERTRSTARITLTAFQLGELEIPPLELRVRGADGTIDSLSSDRYGVEVSSVGADESGDIREIRGPVGIPLSALRLAMWVILPLLLAAALYALVRRLRPRPDEGSAPALGPPPRPAHEIALEALDALAASPLLQQGRVKDYHVIVSDILRTYVEARFRVDAMEMTTQELLERLSRMGIGDSFAEDLRDFLEQCDLVKFAKVRPDAARSEAVLALGRRLIEESSRRVSSSEAA